MSAGGNAEFGRRAFLGAVGTGAGLFLAGGLTGPLRRFGPGPFADLDHVECLARLDASLSPRQRQLIVHPWDEPARQITNTVAIFDRPHIGTVFDPEQRALVRRLYETMLSDQGRARFDNTITLEGKLEGCVLALFSDTAPGELAAAAARGQVQTMITGGHLLLREGGTARSGYAFGGPIAYGQQIGNGEFQVRGNAFAVHGDALNRFYESLAPAERAVALQVRSHHELMVQPQGAVGNFEGVRVGSVAEAAREGARDLVNVVLETYKPEARADAWAALEANGGLDALHVAVYAEYGFYADGSRYSDLTPAERAARELPYWQVWRVEGPGCVIHFQGSPHVHAYINIVRDPTRQNVGPVLTRAAAPLGPSAVRRMLTAALRHETERPLAYVAAAVPARLTAGDVTVGSVHALDPFRERIVIATIRGAAMSDDLQAQAAAQGVAIDPQRTYHVATLTYWAGRADLFGRPERVDPLGRSLRDALVAYLQDRDLGEFHDGIG